MRGEVLGQVERRRRWSAGEKSAVVMASMEPDAVVATVARRFDVTRQQVYDWRRAARRGDFGTPGGVAGFVELVAEPPAHGAALEAEAALAARAPESATPGRWRSGGSRRDGGNHAGRRSCVARAGCAADG